MRAPLVWLALGSGGFAGAPDAPAITDLISRLASESFPAREQASGQILALGRTKPDEIERALVGAFRNSADPEIRFRCKSILMRLFVESVGYLGVSYQAREIFNKAGEMQRVVSMTGIAPESPAAAAGLLAGDMILAIDGQAIDPAMPDLDFARRIQILGAGRRVTLSVSRGAEEIDVNVTLTARPMTLANQDAATLFKERLLELEQKPGRK